MANESVIGKSVEEVYQKTHLIRCMENDSAARASEIGAIVTRYNIEGGREILLPFQKNKNGGTKGGCFISSPFAEDFGQGFLPSLLKNSKPRKVCSSVSLARFQFAHANVPTGYPWRYENQATFSFKENSLLLEIKIKRAEDGFDGTAPVLPRFYPHFACHNLKKIAVAVGKTIYQDFSNKPKLISLEDKKEIIIIRDEKPNFRISLLMPGWLSGQPYVSLKADDEENFFCIGLILKQRLDISGCFLDENQDKKFGLMFSPI